ncbi:hypothetical protein BURC_03284 [Burkholderiaceae bacterium]|nr:hypothetical protein BURC_03284 [Burkholderiaceae bacterium]
MINSALYREPVLLDSKLHRHKRLKGLSDFGVTRNMHAVFLTATEFPQAALDFPIIFINTGERLDSGKPMVSPVALMGLTAGENLRVTAEGRWDARYLPAFIRRFPFLTAGVKGSDAPGVFVDAAWSGFSDTEGEPLFDEQGQPTAALKRAIDFLKRFDDEQQRTRRFCVRLTELDVLKEMQADATMPSGENIKIEGFLTVDEEKLNALPDPVVLELHRNGMLMLLQVHLISLANVRDLVERKAVRMAATPSTATA